MPAVAPSGVGNNEYYGSEEEYLQAVGDALRTEYQAIVECWFHPAGRRPLAHRSIR